MLPHAITHTVDDTATRAIPSAYMAKAGRGEILLRLGEKLKEDWGETCAERKIGQSEAARNLIQWWVKQTPEVQQMVVGALPAKADLIETVLKRIAKEADPVVTGDSRQYGSRRTPGKGGSRG